MSRNHIADTDFEMEVNNEEDANDNSVTNRLVLELAAHPLSSCNPPPEELPDLLDSLIASEDRLKEKLVLIQKVGNGFYRRLQDLKTRLQRLRAANLDLQENVQTSDTNAASELAEKRQVFEAQGRVLQKMCFQTAFILDTFTVKIRNMTISTIKAHRDIFDEFLGERHAHPGIQVADSTKLSCTPDCEWYQKHGPYEWSKKPYSNVWREEMNNTDWDWLRIKEHILTAITVGEGQVIAMYDKLQANSQKFVPSWFWSEDFETWTMHGDMEHVKNADGHLEHKVVVKVRFNKPAAMIQQETANRLKELKKAQIEQGGAEANNSVQSMDGTTVEVDKIGETVIDQNLVFDAMASVPEINGGGPQQLSWLGCWGFERWHAEAVQRGARRAGLQSGGARTQNVQVAT